MPLFLYLSFQTVFALILLTLLFFFALYLLKTDNVSECCSLAVDRMEREVEPLCHPAMPYFFSFFALKSTSPLRSVVTRCVVLCVVVSVTLALVGLWTVGGSPGRYGGAME